MGLSKRCLLQGAIGVACSVGGSAKGRAHLRDVLSLAQGQIEDNSRVDVNVDALLSSAAGRYVTISFAYIGCSGGVPRIKRIQAAVNGTADDQALHLIFDAIDAPHRYPEVLRDITDGEGESFDPRTFKIIFIKKDGLWARQNNKTVRSMLYAMDAPYDEESYLQTINVIRLFDKRGEVLPIRAGHRSSARTV